MPLISSTRSNPWDTPISMLATRLRVSPCSARPVLSSLANSTLTVPSAMFRSTAGWISRLSLPFLPSIVSDRPWKATFVFAGIGIGFLPTRDIPCPLVGSVAPPRYGSADGAQNLAADVFPACLLVRHDPPGGRQDRNAHAVQNGLEVLALNVGAPAGSAD